MTGRAGWFAAKLAATLAASSLAVLTACGSASTSISVEAPTKANDGAMLYMMIRNADKAVTAEGYQDAAAKLFGGEEADPQILSRQPIFPGRDVTVTLEETGPNGIVIYFFFTAPSGEWRVQLQKPLPSQVTIKLGAHEIERTEKR
ncbi:hypothetical protein [Chondromyces apiculatus]|uniref:Type VI lipoprotein IgE-like C-terminal domain-containing protein n=1 Tax=Chondromyces apiculatus DSM 436 TaxID=1192034 RepID=A0A017T7T8_9BACT|nr:hypothetical protein [Chondromyces apiculatus]EYF05022.1 Hypothetical protein CAP_3612 [Chondromyces apiculatus DSM 436]